MYIYLVSKTTLLFICPDLLTTYRPRQYRTVGPTYLLEQTVSPSVQTALTVRDGINQLTALSFNASYRRSFRIGLDWIDGFDKKVKVAFRGNQC
jgi:hypothetical protein